jgi:hypothetical protein
VRSNTTGDEGKGQTQAQAQIHIHIRIRGSRVGSWFRGWLEVGGGLTRRGLDEWRDEESQGKQTQHHAEGRKVQSL